MIHPGHLIFKCRACGKVVRGPDVPSIGDALAFASQGAVVPGRPWDEPITNVSVHSCQGGQLGVTDLIAGVPDDLDDPGPEPVSSSSGEREGG